MLSRNPLRRSDTVNALERMSTRQQTRVVPIRVCARGRDFVIRLKLEAGNRWGSIKDRTAIGLVASVASRLDDASATIIESTSGNLGAALAMIAKELDRRFIAVVDPKLSAIVAARMTAAGATLDFVREPDRHGGYLDARLARVAELLEAIPGAVWTDQYHNPANPLVHRTSTGPELFRQAGDCDSAFVAVSTGGTLAGISQYLRPRGPWIRLIAVDVPGSRVFGEPAGPRLLSGIGASRASSFLTPADWDDVMIVDDETAIAACHQVRDATGLCLGGSSGAVVAACVRYLIREPDVTAPVCVCPDGGASYAHTIYNEDWLRGKAIDLARWQLPVSFEAIEITDE